MRAADVLPGTDVSRGTAGSSRATKPSRLYLPGPMYEALRETAFKERCKIHDLVMQGIDLALRRRGYPSVEDLKAGRKR